MRTSEAIQAEVFEHLAEVGAANDVVDLVLSALEGDETLAAAIGGQSVRRPDPLPPPDPHQHTAVEGVYLSSLTMKGFRGIGPAATLTLSPGPGLTVITGRNGSGKSSFAEALEVVLTGTAYRFGRSEAWKEGWRNVHCPSEPASIILEVQLPGTNGPTLVERTWADTRLDSSVATAQLPGERRKQLHELGWGPPLQSMRPFLTHAELESLLESKPSELHDRLGTVLGLGPVEDAIGRLTEAAKREGELAKQSDRGKKALVEQLQSVNDERARQAIALLRKRVVDLAALSDLGSGSPGADPETTELERLAELPPVDLDTTVELASRLRQSVEQLGDLDTPEHRRADDVAGLLDKGLVAHEGVPRREEVRALLGDLRRLAAVPEVLLTTDGEVDAAQLAVAWQSWSDVVPAGPDLADTDRLVEVANRFEAAALDVQVAHEPAVEAAATALEQREAAWRSVVGPLAAWVEEADAARAVRGRPRASSRPRTG